TVARLTIDGGGADEGAANLTCPLVDLYVGLYYRNGSGTVDSTHVTNVMSATRCSNAIRVESGAGGVANLVVKNSTLDHYGDGLLCAGQSTSCTITGNTFRGRGPVDNQLQAGILIFVGATAAITGNVIRDHFYTPGKGLPNESIGIFLVNADPDTNP